MKRVGKEEEQPDGRKKFFGLMAKSVQTSAKALEVYVCSGAETVRSCE